MLFEKHILGTVINRPFSIKVSMIKVSVIIPSFNRPEKTAIAVKSVLIQNYTDFEVIVIDDGSTEKLREENLFVYNNKNIKCQLIRNEVNAGVSYSRNRGVEHSSGEWIAFLDSDDEWLPQKLKMQMNWIEKNPQYRICQTREIWIRDGVRVNPPKGYEKVSDEIFEISLKRCMITPSSVMIRKDLYEEYHGFNESLPACEDYDLWLKITSKENIGLIDEQLLIRYGGHDDQLSSTIKVLDKYRVRAMLDLLCMGDLSERQRMHVYSVLSQKAEILSNGFRKRGKLKEYERYKKLSEKYR